MDVKNFGISIMKISMASDHSVGFSSCVHTVVESNNTQIDLTKNITAHVL
jgi:hypothetical protein